MSRQKPGYGAKPKNLCRTPSCEEYWNIPLNARADAYAMSANRLGETVPQITTELYRSGYAASKAEFLASLGRQDVHTMQWAAVAVPPTLLWDARADAFALAANQIGQPPL